MSTETKKPTHIAYVVNEPKRRDKKSIWRPVGAVWPHGKGGGFDVVIPEGISVSGRITCTPRTEKPAAEVQSSVEDFEAPEGER